MSAKLKQEVRDAIMEGRMAIEIQRELRIGSALFRKARLELIKEFTEEEKRAAFARMKARNLHERSVVYLLGLNHHQLAQYQRDYNAQQRS